MADIRFAGRLLLIAGATLSLAAQCAQRQDKADDAAMTLLQARLPGRYDNATQARAEARSGSGIVLPAIDLLILPANAALIECAAQRRGLVANTIRARIRIAFPQTGAIVDDSAYVCPLADDGFDVGPLA